jgi:predicted pyridoxine 5'-phosphate oxidase superfamily flavin-nucleotide-binding protein
MSDARIGETPFHVGEIEAQLRAGVRLRPVPIRDFMPEQHRAFFAMLPFLVVATNDAEGWPIATLLTGAPGFVTSPDPRRLRIATLPDPIDPIATQLIPGAPIGLLGIDLATRRRNRANGRIVARDTAIDIAVDQSFGNCPQYIQTRAIHAAEEEGASQLERLKQLDDAAVAQIGAADTFFVGTSTAARHGHAFGVDISHRGGRPGFVRVDGAVLTIPDFRGNRYFNTLGNLMLEPRAALLFIDFERGDLLHVQGATEIIWEDDEVQRFAGAERLWRVRVQRAWRRRGALKLRWDFHDFSPTTIATGSWSSR